MMSQSRQGYYYVTFIGIALASPGCYSSHEIYHGPGDTEKPLAPNTYYKHSPTEVYMAKKLVLFLATLC